MIDHSMIGGKCDRSQCDSCLRWFYPGETRTRWGHHGTWYHGCDVLDECGVLEACRAENPARGIGYGLTVTLGIVFMAIVIWTYLI